MDLSTTSYSIICVFALLINKASLQDVNVVEGVTGGFVVLPCVTNEIEQRVSDTYVFWRHNASLPVCAIIEGKLSLQDQDFTYKNRAETFPTEYERGNFSLKLNNLTQTDAGNYECFIMHSAERVITQLIIKESTVQQPTEENENQAQETHLWMILTPVFSVFILLCIVLCIIFKWKKRCKTHRSGLSPPEGTLPSKDVFHDDLELHEG